MKAALALAVVLVVPPVHLQEPGGAPPGWRRVGPPEGVSLYEVAIDTAVRHGGSQSLRVRAKTVQTEVGTVLAQTFRADDFRNGRVRLRGYVRTQDASFGAQLWMRVDGSASASPFDNMSDRRVSGTVDWHPYDLVLDVPVDAAVIQIGLIFNGTGTAWIDDLQFSLVDKSTATTGENRPPVQRSAPTSDLPRTPQNLGFEDR